MAKNAITVLEEGLKKANELNAQLININNTILSINDSALKVSKNAFNIKSPSDLNNSLNQNKTFVQQLNVELQERQRLEKALATQLERNRQAESATAKALALARFEQQQMNKSAREAAILSSKLATEYQKQSLILNQLRTKYKDVALTQGESSKAAKNLLIQITALDTKLKNVDASVGQFQRNVGNYGKAMQSVISGFRNLAGAFGFTSALIIAVDIMKRSFKTIKDFNSGLLNVSKTAGITGSSLTKFGDDVIKLSNRLGTVGTKALLEYATVAGQLGVKGSKNILNFAESLAKLQTASDITGEEGGASIARLLTLTDGGVENVKAFSDEIVNLGNNFAATEAEILGNATAIAQNTGVYKLGRQESLAFGVATKAVGIESEITGSTIGKTLGIIEKAIRTTKGLEDISRLTGIAQKDLGNAFKENSGAVLTKLIAGLNGVDKAGGSVNEQLEKLGITAIRDQRVIGTLATAGYDTLAAAILSVADASGSLDKEFTTASGKLENQINRIGIAWDNFTLNIEDGQGILGTLITKYADLFTTSLDKVNLILNENTTFFEKWKTAINLGVGNVSLGLIKPFEESTNILIENSKAIDENTGLVDEQTQAFVNQYGSIAPLTDEQIRLNKATDDYYNILSNNESTTKENTETIGQLRASIATLKNELEGIDKTDKESIKTKLALIKTKEDELAAILGTNKARQEASDIIKGSIAFLEKEVSLLEEKQSKLAKSSKEYFDQEKAVRKAKEAVQDFKDEVAQLLLQLDGVSVLESVGDFESSYKKIQDILKAGKPKIEGVDADGANDKANDEIKAFIDLEKEKAAQRLDIEKRFNESKKSLEMEAFNTSIALVNTIFDAKVQRYEDDINRNNDYYAKLLDNEALTEEQRSALEAERDRKNLELEKKKREAQRQAAVFNKLASIATIAIQTATASAAALAPPPVGLGPVAGGALLPYIIGNGALQTALVLAQPIPKYEMGKGDYDNYEGLAIWGEKRQEAKISKDGSIELSPNKIGNHLTHVKKDDIIIPDASKYLSSMSDKELYANLHKHTILSSMAHQKNTIDNYLMAKSIDNQTDRLVKAFQDNKPKVNIHNNIKSNVSDDIRFALKLNNTL